MILLVFWLTIKTKLLILAYKAVCKAPPCLCSALCMLPNSPLYRPHCCPIVLPHYCFLKFSIQLYTSYDAFFFCREFLCLSLCHGKMSCICQDPSGWSHSFWTFPKHHQCFGGWEMRGREWGRSWGEINNRDFPYHSLLEFPNICTESRGTLLPGQTVYLSLPGYQPGLVWKIDAPLNNWCFLKKSFN